MSNVKSSDELKNIILIVGSLPGSSRRQILEVKEKLGDKYHFGLIYDRKDNRPDPLRDKQIFDVIISTKFNSPDEISKDIAPYKDQLKAVTCFAESKISYFRKLIPVVPYLKTPTVQSLEWSTNKIQMRKRLRAYDKKISPKFLVVKEANKKTLDKIEKTLELPVVVKPSGLAASALVTIAYHREELEKAIKKNHRKINKLYRDTGRSDEPQVLVEEFIEGKMYSVDAYVDDKGNVSFCPPVYIKTGREIGFDDFFGYAQMTPTRLKESSIEEMQLVCTKSIHALHLRNTTVHVELFRTEDGWKVIELGPRIGGFRNTMYELSYGFSHAINDIRNRIGRKVKIKKRVKGYTAAMKFYAQKEGIIKSIRGVRKARKLNSFHAMAVHKKKGDKATFVRNGGKSVFDIMLHNEKRTNLLADIRRLEKMIDIKVK